MRNMREGGGEEGERDWASLPDGIVVQIGEILLADDLLPYISLRSVCSSWRQATENPVNTERCFRPHNWILIHPISNVYESDCLTAKLSLCSQNRYRFVNISSGKYIWANIPELRSHCVLACVDGLLLLTQFEALFHACDIPTRLLNPFTGTMTDFPALSQLHTLYDELCNTLQLPLLATSIRFVSSSSSSSTLMVLTEGEVFYANPGSKEWKILNNPEHWVDAFFQGRTYGLTISGDMTRFELVEKNPGQVDLRIKHLEVASQGPSRFLLESMPSMVESDGELLVISSVSKYFEVWKVVIVEGDDGDEKVSLIRVNDIGERALFISGNYGSLSVSTTVFPCFKPSSIYFYPYHVSSPTAYHLCGARRCQPLEPYHPPLFNCCWPDKKAPSQYIRNTLSLFPAL